MPRLPKPAHLRQNSERRDFGLAPRPPVGVIVPLPPRGLLKATRDSWTSFFSSPLAQSTVALATDLPAVARLWGLYDERERAMIGGKKKRLVFGSKNQPVLNPLLEYAVRLDPEIRQLEDRFGLTPMARLKLGIIFGDSERSLAQLNADAEDDDHDAAEAADIRQSLARPVASDVGDEGDSLVRGEPGPRTGRRRGPASAAS